MSRSKTKTESSQSNPVGRYLRETRGELRKVVWPTREEAWRLTAIVLAVTLASAAFLWFWDTVFSNGLHFLIQQIVGV
ncbi:MAG: preprotein translocase subunit SecE [Candidatus Promineifilaceae bacterium]